MPPTILQDVYRRKGCFMLLVDIYRMEKKVSTPKDDIASWLQA